MLQNFIKIAVRNLVKNKVYSFINILGLATGMAVTLLIGFWVADEVNYNRNFKNYDRILQVMCTQTFNGIVNTGPACAVPLGMELRSKYTSDFKQVTLASWNFGHTLAVGEKRLNNTGMWVQPEFADIFSTKMLSGNLYGLTDPNSILVNETLAKSLFGNEEPLGKTIRIDNRLDLKVAGVFEDYPLNSSLDETKFLMSWDKYVSIENWVKESSNQWDNHSFQIYALLNEGINIASVDKKIRGISRRYVKQGDEWSVLQPMKNWHLYSEFKNGKIEGAESALCGCLGSLGFLFSCWHASIL